MFHVTAIDLRKRLLINKVSFRRSGYVFRYAKKSDPTYGNILIVFNNSLSQRQ